MEQNEIVEDEQEFKKTSLKTVLAMLGEFEYPVEVFVSDNQLCISIAYADELTAQNAFDKINIVDDSEQREDENSYYKNITPISEED